MTKTKSVRRWADHTRAAVLAGGWNQTNGWIPKDAPDDPCCIGVKLAIAYEVLHGRREIKGFDYTDGMDAANADLGSDDDQLEGVLMACGASNDPFGVADWPVDRRTVWDRLRWIEKLPANSVYSRTQHEALTAVRCANRQIWQFLYGIEVDTWPELDSDAFWDRFVAEALHRRDEADIPIEAPAGRVPA